MYKQKNDLYIQTMKKIIRDNNINFDNNFKEFLIILNTYYQGTFSPLKIKNSQLFNDDIVKLLNKNCTIGKYSEQCKAILIKINELYDNRNQPEVKKIFRTHKMGESNTIDDSLISLIGFKTFECDLNNLTVYDYLTIVRHWSFKKSKYYKSGTYKKFSRGDLGEK